MQNKERARLRGLALGLVATLSACGGDGAVEDVPRPVLVEQPRGGTEAAGSSYAGEVRAREESPLAFQIPGRLTVRHVDAGARVTRGQLLAELDPGDQRLQAEAAQAQLAAAEAELQRVRADRQRYQALLGERLVSQSAMDAQDAAWRAAEEQARAARARLHVARNQAGYARLLAPRDGVVTTRLAEAGEIVAAGQPVYVLAGDGPREVAIALPESRIEAFALGQPVEVELWDRPGPRLPGRIREIAAAADPQARTFAARVALEADDAPRVALGQSARVHVRQGGERAAPSVPLSALQPAPGGGHALWVVDPASSTLRLVPVEPGAQGGARVPVLAGLDAGQWVVVAGGHLLREGQKVAPVDRDNRPVVLAAGGPEAARP